MKTKTNHLLATLNPGGLLGLAAVILIATSGCKTKAARDSGFLTGEQKMSEQRERFPFHRVWVKPDVNKENYDSLIIAPVNTDYMLESTGWKAVNPGNMALDNAAKDLADYTKTTFTEAFNRPKDNRFRITTSPGPKTVRLELAITEIVPSKAALNALSIAAPNMYVSAAAGAAAGKPSIAIEGRLVDSQTGELLFQFADRQEPQMRVVNVQGLTWWSHGREAIRDWAAQCVELANTPADAKVKDRMPFTLKPWSN